MQEAGVYVAPVAAAAEGEVVDAKPHQTADDDTMMNDTAVNVGGVADEAMKVDETVEEEEESEKE